MAKTITIDDLLNALQNPSKESVSLKNTRETWERIGNHDKFEELGLTGDKLDDFLKEWIEDNPYDAI